MPDHHAFLNAAPDALITPLAEMAEQNGFDVQRLGQTCKIAAPLGHVTFVRRGAGAEVTFSAGSDAELQVLMDLYAQRIEGYGFEAAMTWDSPRGPVPLNQRIAHVAGSRQISPNFVRLRLEGDFTAFLPQDAGLHFRFLFGPGGADWPTLDHRGVTQWPGGPGAWHRPVYTVREISTAGDWVDVDIALHAGGRASDWCRDARSGTEIAVTGPNGGALRKAAWLGLIGDETALPVIYRMLGAAPDHTRGKAILFLRDDSDAQQIELPGGVDLHIERMHLADPVEAVAELKPDQDDFYMFFAAERTQVGRARALFRERGYPSRAFTAASYWTAPSS
ncbi:MAG: siderophore-interacting protein [Pseudomonadota bacterium]